MGSIYVAFQFDVEDFVTPEADDVLLKIVDILDQFGVRGSFCLVGEKARVLERRGRLDVLGALKKHDIAYQSNFHSVHPVISEYLEDKGWHEGVETFKRHEGPGLEYLKSLFGISPSAFIQPGGSWAPQAPYALREMGVPVYVDGIFQEAPVWFCGSLCLKAAMGFPEHSTFFDLGKLKSRFEEIYNSKIGGGLITVIMHPCMFVTEDFWDAVNFSRGRNPPSGELMSPPLRGREEVEESLEVLRAFVSFILDHADVKIVTFREVAKLFREPEERRLNLGQIHVLAKRASERNDWQIVDGTSISPAEMLRLFVDVIIGYFQRGSEPEVEPIRFTLGPTSRTLGNHTSGNIDVKDVLEVSRLAKSFMDKYGELPPAISKEGNVYGPGFILEATAKTVSYYCEHGGLPDSVEVRGLSDIPEVVRRWDLIERISDQWDWIIFPIGFKSDIIEELTLLQAWTMRPAILVGSNGTYLP
jgi:hypothetical protein